MCCLAQPLAKGKLIKLADFEPFGLTPEHIALVLLDAWGPDGSSWQTLLRDCGYDPKKVRPAAKAEVPFVLAMHSSQRLTLRLAELPVPLADQTLCEAVAAFGKARPDWDRTARAS